MKLVLVQKDCRDTDWRKWLRQAEALKPDLIVMGELATSGCLYQPKEFEKFESVISEVSRVSCPVIIGTPREIDGGLHNSAVYVDGDEVQVYDKVNLFEPMNEPNVYRPGRVTGMFDSAIGRLGIAICYDLRFENLFREMKQQGAVLAIVPAAFPLVRIDAWQRLLVERAKENEMPVIGVNAVGDDGTNEFGGSTMVVAPDGSVLVQADQRTSSLIEVELDLQKMSPNRSN